MVWDHRCLLAQVLSELVPTGQPQSLQGIEVKHETTQQTQKHGEALPSALDQATYSSLSSRVPKCAAGSCG
jgi:hypothetical protein